MLPPQAKKELATLLGPRGYLDRPEDLSLYEYDGSVDKSRPDLVVFPRTTEDVVAIVKITREHNVPIVGRGAGSLIHLAGPQDHRQGLPHPRAHRQHRRAEPVDREAGDRRGGQRRHRVVRRGSQWTSRR